MSEGRLAGKTALITGGASGIGAACAERFIAEGADVMLADLNSDRVSGTAQRLRATSNRKVCSVAIDTSNESDVSRCIDEMLNELGRVDVVVAAAGVSYAQYRSGDEAPGARQTGEPARSLLDQPVADWQRVLDINVTGVMLTDRFAAKAMIAAGHGGSIVNIASAAAKVPLLGAGDYCVSKAAVAMLTKALGLELAAQNIRVNAIGPGFIETPMTADLAATDDGKAMMLAMTPMGHLGKPLDIANAALYLACDESAFMTGQTIYPTGGLFVG